MIRVKYAEHFLFKMQGWSVRRTATTTWTKQSLLSCVTKSMAFPDAFLQSTYHSSIRPPFSLAYLRSSESNSCPQGNQWHSHGRNIWHCSESRMRRAQNTSKRRHTRGIPKVTVDGKFHRNSSPAPIIIHLTGCCHNLCIPIHNVSFWTNLHITLSSICNISLLRKVKNPTTPTTLSQNRLSDMQVM